MIGEDLSHHILPPLLLSVFVNYTVFNLIIIILIEIYLIEIYLF